MTFERNEDITGRLKLELIEWLSLILKLLVSQIVRNQPVQAAIPRDHAYASTLWKKATDFAKESS